LEQIIEAGDFHVPRMTLPSVWKEATELVGKAVAQCRTENGSMKAGTIIVARNRTGFDFRGSLPLPLTWHLK
jgi:hypothetical protein